MSDASKKVDATLLWGARIAGLSVMASVLFVIAGVVIVFVATLIYGR